MENTEVTNQSAVKVGKKLSGWLKGFIVLFALFFAAGFATLGSFRNTGKSFAYTPMQVRFQLPQPISLT